MIVSTEGDCGDCTYLMAILHGLGGQHEVLLQISDRTKAKGEDGITTLCNLMVPLLASQSYITSARRHKPDDTVDWQSAKFRLQGHYRQGETLMRAHLNNLIATHSIGQHITGKDKWITATPDKRSAGKIVVNRSGRYRNQYFPWPEVVRHYSHRIVFVGLPHEHREFCGHFGYVDYLPTYNMLEVAQLIEGSELFIGNQSCAFAIAEGLKKRRILEVSLEFPDTIFGGGQYVVDGNAYLPNIQGSGEMDVPSKAYTVDQVYTREQPKGGWQYTSPETGQIMTSDVQTCARELRKRLKHTIDMAAAERLVIAQNVERVPRHFMRHMHLPNFNRVRAALASAGVTDHPLFDPAQTVLKLAS